MTDASLDYADLFLNGTQSGGTRSSKGANQDLEPVANEFFVDWPNFWDRSRHEPDWLFDDVLGLRPRLGVKAPGAGS